MESEISESIRLERVYSDYHQFTNNLLSVWRTRIAEGRGIFDGSDFFGVNESREMMGGRDVPILAVGCAESVTSIGDSSLGSKYMESERDDGDRGSVPDSEDDDSVMMSN